MSGGVSLEEQVLAAEQMASDTESKLARLLVAVKADREARPPLAPDTVVDERYVQRMEDEADIAEAEIAKLTQKLHGIGQKK
jgi:hypothetical protein